MQYLLTESRNRQLTIILNRPNRLNALNKALLAELHQVLEHAASDAATGGLILTGSGEKAFAAGADIAEFAGFDVKAGTALAREGQEQVFNLIEEYPKPIIAALNGYALGGGLELALACHLRIASSNVRLGFPEVSLGLIPGYGGTQRLTRLAGKGAAMEMILTGKMISAEEALHMRLLNSVVSRQEELLPVCRDLLGSILKNAPLAVAAAIKAINASPGKTGFETEIAEFGKLFGTEDFREGTKAFLEKRAPDFKGK